VTDGSFSTAGAASVAEAGGVVWLTGTTPALNAAFNRLSTTAITVARTSTGNFEVTIPGLTFYFNEQITQITLLDSGAAIYVRTNSTNNHLLVRTYNAAGVLTDPGGFVRRVQVTPSARVAALGAAARVGPSSRPQAAFEAVGLELSPSRRSR
jgi:hypothetical protein